MSRPPGPAGLAVEHHPATPPGGRRVVFVHGSMDRAAAFAKVVRRLPDLECVRYDRRGYGRSVTAGVADGLDGHVADLEAVLDGTPSVVVGHSLGGIITLVLAERRPDLVLAAGIFEAPMGWVPWWPRRSAGNAALGGEGADVDPGDAAERFLRRMIGDERWERLPAGTRAHRRAEGPALLAEIRAVRSAGPPYDVRRVQVPVVAGRGSATTANHRRATAELAGAIPGAELWEIDGAGHRAPATHPDEFASFVRRVVARIPSGLGGEHPPEGKMPG